MGSIPMPEHRLITIIGAEFDEFGHPDLDQYPLCWAGKEQIQLYSAISAGHRAHVRVEAWDSPAPTDTDSRWETDATTELLSTTGTLVISALDERALTAPLVIGTPGRYSVRVHAAGRARLRALRQQPTWYDHTPTGIERFRVRLWPANATTTP